MTVFYKSINTNTWVCEPQMTRWRSRYRGHRESLKINNEINQIGYDIFKLYSLTGQDATSLDANLYDIEFGRALNAQMYWKVTNTTENTTTLGVQTMVQRVQDLQRRVTLLEDGWS